MNQRTAIVTILLASTLLAVACAFPHVAGVTLSLPIPAPTNVTPIYEIQGTGASSPMVDARVDTLGLVTAVTRNGFYLQDPGGDGNPDTSDGIYVFTYTPPSLRRGECVAVGDALVQEYYGKTELSWVGAVEPSDACSLDSVLPIVLPPARLGMHVAEQYERWEGMLVQLNGLDGFVHGPTKRYASGEAEIAYLPSALQPAVRHGRILRDGSDSGSDVNAQARDALQYLSTLIGGELPAANWGDRLHSDDNGAAPLDAVMDYNFGKYQLLLLPGESVLAEASPIQEEAPDLAVTPQDFTVCTFNVHGLGQGAAQFSDPQDYALAVERRAQVIAETLAGCTIIGIQETGTPEDAQALAERLSAGYGLPYLAVALPGPASDDGEFPLTNSFLVRTDRVTVNDWFSSQGCSTRDYDVRELDADPCPPGEYPLFNRPPLVLDVAVRGEWGEPYALRLINNHWKSKAGDEPVNAERRLLQARHVADIVRDSAGAEGSRPVIALGDLNDFADSEPLAELIAGDVHPLVNVWDYLPQAQRYSFIFDGASQVLDHILIPPNMVQLLSGAGALHVNSDLAMRAAGNAGPGGQVSDHDLLMIRLRPDGAAAVSGDLGFPGIRVELEHVESGLSTETHTGVDGAFRLWGIEPGEVRIWFDSPGWLTVAEASMTTTLPAGVTVIESPQVRLASAGQAAASAFGLLDAIATQQ